jgi:hypothetical protein
MLLGNRNRFATLANLAARYLAPAHASNPIVGDVPLYRRRDPAEYRPPNPPGRVHHR